MAIQGKAQHICEYLDITQKIEQSYLICVLVSMTFYFQLFRKECVRCI